MSDVLWLINARNQWGMCMQAYIYHYRFLAITYQDLALDAEAQEAHSDRDAEGAFKRIVCCTNHVSGVVHQFVVLCIRMLPRVLGVHYAAADHQRTYEPVCTQPHP